MDNTEKHRLYYLCSIIEPVLKKVGGLSLALLVLKIVLLWRDQNFYLSIWYHAFRECPRTQSNTFCCTFVTNAYLLTS